MCYWIKFSLIITYNSFKTLFLQNYSLNDVRNAKINLSIDDNQFFQLRTKISIGLLNPLVLMVSLPRWFSFSFLMKLSQFSWELELFAVLAKRKFKSLKRTSWCDKHISHCGAELGGTAWMRFGSITDSAPIKGEALNVNIII